MQRGHEINIKRTIKGLATIMLQNDFFDQYQVSKKGRFVEVGIPALDIICNMQAYTICKTLKALLALS